MRSVSILLWPSAVLVYCLMTVGSLQASASIWTHPITEIHGNKTTVFDYQQDHLLVIAVTNTTCPLCRKYAPKLVELEKMYASRGVKFLYVNPTSQSDTQAMTQMIDSVGFQGTYVIDPQNALIEILDAHTTTETYLVSKAGQIVYRGAVDDQFGIGYAKDAASSTFLKDAIESQLTGTMPLVTTTEAPGCMLSRNPQPKVAEDQTTMTYFGQVAHIMQEKCVNCHREGGVGPFRLDRVSDLLEHQGMIEYVVSEGLMPPWFANQAAAPDTHFANDRSLSRNQKQTLLSWLSSDHPLGQVSEGPVPVTYPEEWQIGKPDMIVQLPEPVEVKATGTMAYQHLVVDPDLTSDRWIESVEIRPTDPSVVHHVLVFEVAPGEGLAKRGEIDEEEGFFAAYVPGNSFQIYGSGFGRRLAKGSRFVFQLHYTPNGTATTDQTRMGIKFADKPPEHLIRVVGVSNHRLTIPPGASHHPQVATKQVPVDVKVLSFTPHMHLRGSAFRYDIVSTSGDRQTVLDIPHYDFNWQLEYKLAQPLSVKAGSRIEATAWYDNSTAIKPTLIRSEPSNGGLKPTTKC